MRCFVRFAATFVLSVPPVIAGCLAPAEDASAEGQVEEAREAVPNAGAATPPSYPAPSYPAPVYPAPVYAAPTYGPPQYTAPVYEAPNYQAPGYAAPGYPVPGTPSGQAPAGVAPTYAAPQYGAPTYAAPIYLPPIYIYLPPITVQIEGPARPVATSVKSGSTDTSSSPKP